VSTLLGASTGGTPLWPFIPAGRQPLRELYERLHSQKRRIRHKPVGIDRRKRGPTERQPSFFATQLDNDPIPARSLGSQDELKWRAVKGMTGVGQLYFERLYSGGIVGITLVSTFIITRRSIPTTPKDSIDSLVTCTERQ